MILDNESLFNFKCFTLNVKRTKCIWKNVLFSVLFSVSALYVVNSIYVYLRSGHFEF